MQSAPSVSFNKATPVAAEVLKGLNYAVAAGRYPDEAELPSGVYDLYVPIEVSTEKLLRIPILFWGSDSEGRWMYSRVPTHFYEYPTPKIVREMTGPVTLMRGYI